VKNLNLNKKILGFTNGVPSIRLNEAILKIVNDSKLTLPHKKNKKEPIFIFKNLYQKKISIHSNLELQNNLTCIFKFGYFKFGILRTINNLNVIKKKKISYIKLLYIYISGYISNSEKKFVFDKLRLILILIINIFFIISSPWILKKRVAKYILR
jgi:hypothetical protein